MTAARPFRMPALAAALTFTAGAACAQEDDFSMLDADASGGLSLAEVQAAAPEVSTEEFSAYDADGSGELSPDEFGAWKASKSED